MNTQIESDKNSRKEKLKAPPKRLRLRLPQITDSEGHYDIDGVSFCQGLGVIVASDSMKKLENPKP